MDVMMIVILMLVFPVRHRFLAYIPNDTFLQLGILMGQGLDSILLFRRKIYYVLTFKNIKVNLREPLPALVSNKWWHPSGWLTLLLGFCEYKLPFKLEEFKGDKNLK